MSIMEKIFGSAKQQPQVQQQQPGTPGNIPAVNNNPAMASNPTVPAASMEVSNISQSPLDQFKDVWQTDPNAVAPEAMFAGVTQQSLQTSAKKNDFTKVVTPELMSAIAAGGEGAIQATLQAMNAMTQKGFGDSAFATTKIIEQALEKQQAKFEAMLPNLIKSHNVGESLQASNPIFSHPASAPVLEMFKTQAIQKYPNASAAEIQKMASDYLVAFASVGNPVKPTASQARELKNATDWSTF